MTVGMHNVIMHKNIISASLLHDFYINDSMIRLFDITFKNMRMNGTVRNTIHPIKPDIT